MSSEHMNYFTKDTLDIYLKALSKEYKRLGGKNMPAEIILIGGAAIVANYGFRDMTTDIDAVIHAASTMKDAINNVRDEYNLPAGWLNSDFMKTASYSAKLDEYSVYYKTYSNVLQIRTISSEYLIAMKLRSGRKYKKDLSDIVGILSEHQARGETISIVRIKQAVIDLYGSWDFLPEDSKIFIDDIIKSKNYDEIYKKISDDELHSKSLLIKFEKDYPNVAKTENVDNILRSLKKRKD